MRKTILRLMPVLAIIISIAMLETQTFGSSIPNASLVVAQTDNTHAPSQPAQGPVVLNRKTAATPGDKSEEHFHQASESFLKKDAHAAAVGILKGAAFLKLEASRSTGEARKALTASERELERLAGGVEKGTVTSVQDLRRAFARADRALAEEHLQNAVESWSKKEVDKTGQELKLAADDVELALSWAGHRLNTTTEAAVKDAHAVAAKLTEGGAWTREEVGKGLDRMSKEVGKLREQV
jgi:hypothetical protein